MILRSVLFNVFFFVWSAIFLIACMPTLFRGTRTVYFVGHYWARVVLWGLRLICGLGYELRGLENLPAPPYLLVSKHQSAWDTLIFSQFIDHPCHVLKAELAKIPVFGFYVAGAGMIAVDRKGGSKTLKKMVADAKERISEGRTIVIFPEGTRTAPGETRPYHPGVAAIYNASDVPLVPVALNSGLFWGRNAFRKNPGTIVLQVLPPIPSGLPRKEVMVRLTDEIEETSLALQREGEAASATTVSG